MEINVFPMFFHVLAVTGCISASMPQININY